MMTVFINKTPSEVKEFLTASRRITLKAAYFEYAYKLLNGSMYYLGDAFNSQYNKLYVAEEYHKFLKQQNIVFSCIGKAIASVILKKI